MPEPWIQRVRSQPILTAVLLASLFAFSAYGFLSKNPYSGDDITHYLISHYSWTHPQLFVHVWGRPAYTIPSSLFAQFGMRAAGFFNILVSLLACYVAFELARTIGLRRPWLAAAFTALQPFFFQLSFGTLTEPLFAFLLSAAVLFYLRGHRLRSALCVSLLPLARLEGFAFLLLWFLLLARRREPKALICLFIFPALWNAVGFVITGAPFYLWSYNPYTRIGLYGYGTWMHYVMRWPAITGPALLPLVTVGLVYGITRRGNLVHVLTILFFVLQTILFKVGLSAGYERFFVCAAPLLAVIAAQGVHYLLEELPGLQREDSNNRAPGFARYGTMHCVLLVLLAAPAILGTWRFFQPDSPLGRLALAASWLVLLTVLGAIIRGGGLASVRLQRVWILLILAIAILGIARWIRPPRVHPENELLSDVAKWYLAREWQTRPVIILHPSLWIALNRDPFADLVGLGSINLDEIQKFQQRLLSALPGTLILWDSHSFPNEWGTPLDFFDQAHFRMVREWQTNQTQPFRVVVLEKVST